MTADQRTRSRLTVLQLADRGQMVVGCRYCPAARESVCRRPAAAASQRDICSVAASYKNADDAFHGDDVYMTSQPIAVQTGTPVV